MKTMKLMGVLMMAAAVTLVGCKREAKPVTEAGDDLGTATKSVAERGADMAKDAAVATRDAAVTAAEKTADVAKDVAEGTQAAAAKAMEATGSALEKTGEAVKDAGARMAPEDK